MLTLVWVLLGAIPCPGQQTEAEKLYARGLLPEVVSTYPVNGAGGIPLKTTLSFSFDRPMHPDIQTLSISPEVEGLRHFKYDPKTYTFSCTLELEPNTEYAVAVNPRNGISSSGAGDESKARWEGFRASYWSLAPRYTWKFRTTPTAVRTPPKSLRMSAAVRCLGAPTLRPSDPQPTLLELPIEFSGPIDPRSFVVETNHPLDILGLPTKSNGGRTLVFKCVLQPSRAYELKVSAANLMGRRTRAARVNFRTMGLELSGRLFPRTDPKVVEVLRRARSARSALESFRLRVYRSGDDLGQVFSVAPGSNGRPFVLRYKTQRRGNIQDYESQYLWRKPNLFRAEFTSSMNGWRMGFDGETAWSFAPWHKDPTGIAIVIETDQMNEIELILADPLLSQWSEAKLLRRFYFNRLPAQVPGTVLLERFQLVSAGPEQARYSHHLITLDANSLLPLSIESTGMFRSEFELSGVNEHYEERDFRFEDDSTFRREPPDDLEADQAHRRIRISDGSHNSHARWGVRTSARSISRLSGRNFSISDDRSLPPIDFSYVKLMATPRPSPRPIS